MTENIKCACCDLDIIKHNEICFVSCLAYLSGYANVMGGETK